jgi:hypothetical protein
VIPSERIELGIYAFVKAQGGRQRPTSISPLATQLGIEDWRVVEALKRLHVERRIELHKCLEQQDFTYDAFVLALSRSALGKTFNETDFFDRGDFLIKIAAAGRPYFEELELKELEDGKAQMAADEPSRPKVFISCGQCNQEPEVGRALARVIDELTACTGYFAQNENSLEAVSTNIFKALNSAVGFVGVMHNRGSVTTPEGHHERGSVWVEQELAIAAFLVQAQGRRLPVALYIQKGIRREGVRQQILLNKAVEFECDEEIVADFRLRVRAGLFRPIASPAGSETDVDPKVLERVKAKWEQLQPEEQEAVRLLLLEHRLTDQQALQALHKKGLAMNWMRAYTGVERTNLVERVAKTAGPKEHVTGYTGQWQIVPEYKAPLEILAWGEQSAGT